jgi:hypothetical protein
MECISSTSVLPTLNCHHGNAGKRSEPVLSVISRGVWRCACLRRVFDWHGWEIPDSFFTLALEKTSGMTNKTRSELRSRLFLKIVFVTKKIYLTATPSLNPNLIPHPDRSIRKKIPAHIPSPNFTAKLQIITQ